ncbi:hypothetical protein KAR91_77450 [Candidatus Pacearchaeota archaeon]|nr:hypothetical protein [Candidatus Pacearchaeota archaeon]
MDSKLDKLMKQAEKLGIELDANETIADLEAKIWAHKNKTTENKKEQPKPTRGRVIERKTFTRRVDREAKKNG